MTLRKIATIGNPVLRAPTRDVGTAELASSPIQQLIDDMIETMHDANGAGLAANQVYASLRICVMHVESNPRYPYKPRLPLTVLINPRLEATSDAYMDVYEGCLSVPALRGEVRRAAHIRVRALDRTGAPLDYAVAGLTAGTFQHEVDHLDGKLFIDQLTSPLTLCTWSDFERFRQVEFVARANAIVSKYGS
jgi:peptide deformylase